MQSWASRRKAQFEKGSRFSKARSPRREARDESPESVPLLRIIERYGTVSRDGGRRPGVHRGTHRRTASDAVPGAWAESRRLSGTGAGGAVSGGSADHADGRIAERRPRDCVPDIVERAAERSA